MLLRPKLVVSAVHEVTLDLLREHKLSAVMVDLDDTLVAAAHEGLDPRFSNWAKSLHDAAVPVLMLSNGSPSRVAKYAALLEIPSFAMVGKPSLWAFRKGLKVLERPAQETAMVGDQLFTDILGANLIGMASILVDPLSPGRLPHTRFLRKVERLILRGYARALAS
ncbi:MAG: YqeG family HAD IIIA-type phosphatase [Deinococcota bacterium]|nr:YqeG family HAD IIIA-type phosphatase [Deinococcota bacterium]